MVVEGIGVGVKVVGVGEVVLSPPVHPVISVATRNTNTTKLANLASFIDRPLSKTRMTRFGWYTYVLVEINHAVKTDGERAVVTLPRN